MLETLLYFAAAGAAIGFLSGLFGIGGGAFLVPLFILSLAGTVADDLLVQCAVATSLACIGCMTASAAWAQHRRQMIDWDTARWLLIGLVCGVLVGSWYAAASASGALMRTLLGVLLLLSAAQTALNWQPAAGLFRLNSRTLLGIGGVTGTLSAMGGIGGGILIVPSLLASGMGIHRATAASAAGGFAIALAATSVFSLRGADIDQPYSTGLVYWPGVLGVCISGVLTARLGVRINHRTHPLILRWSFASVGALISGWLLLGDAA
ncbi:MAG: sulfite exporter TauE/SafE family protein [Gammaproteobacteria bacterium AqS3]|nr:sulfite exporter TauE/SafE family protein [Gammaproteobacteria bacterium AqS3]